MCWSIYTLPDDWQTCKMIDWGLGVPLEMGEATWPLLGWICFFCIWSSQLKKFIELALFLSDTVFKRKAKGAGIFQALRVRGCLCCGMGGILWDTAVKMEAKFMWTETQRHKVTILCALLPIDPFHPFVTEKEVNATHKGQNYVVGRRESGYTLRVWGWKLRQILNKMRECWRVWKNLQIILDLIFPQEFEFHPHLSVFL